MAIEWRRVQATGGFEHWRAELNDSWAMEVWGRRASWTCALYDQSDFPHGKFDEPSLEKARQAVESYSRVFIRNTRDACDDALEALGEVSDG